jgi:hypothetical protein
MSAAPRRSRSRRQRLLGAGAAALDDGDDGVNPEVGSFGFYEAQLQLVPCGR